MKMVLCWRCNSNCVHALRIPKDRGYKSWCLMIGMKLISCPSLRRGIAYSTLCTEIDFLDETHVLHSFWLHVAQCFWPLSFNYGRGEKINVWLVSACFDSAVSWKIHRRKPQSVRRGEGAFVKCQRNLDKHTMCWLNRSGSGLPARVSDLTMRGCLCVQEFLSSLPTHFSERQAGWCGLVCWLGGNYRWPF